MVVIGLWLTTLFQYPLVFAIHDPSESLEMIAMHCVMIAGTHIP